MTDWQKAREAAEDAISELIDKGGFSESRYLDAALSALSAAGYKITPGEPTKTALDRGVAFALNVSVIMAGGYSDYCRALYQTMLEGAQHDMEGK